MRRRIGYGALSIVLLAVAIGWWVLRGDGSAAIPPDLSRPSAVVSPTEVPAITAGSGTVAPSVPAMAAAPAAVAPPTAARPAASFDVVRVNPQGNAVIAGRAVPSADVVAFDGDTVIGRATADKRGEWVILPEMALLPGLHTLRVGAPPPSDQRTAASSEEISIMVPVPSSAVVAAMPAVAAPSSPRNVPEDLTASSQAKQAKSAQGAPARDMLAQAALIQDKATQDKAARDKNLVVLPGNSLWRIARNSYGAGRRYAIIYGANRDRIGDPDLIYPGQVFTLPEPN